MKAPSARFLAATLGLLALLTGALLLLSTPAIAKTPEPWSTSNARDWDTDDPSAFPSEETNRSSSPRSDTNISGATRQILLSCDDGHSTWADLRRRFTPKQLQHARSEMGSDQAEYTGCADVINRALSAITSRGQSSRTTNPFSPQLPATPAEAKALEKAAEEAVKERVEVGEKELQPGASGFSSLAPRSPVPTSLKVLLALCGVAMLAALIPAGRRALTWWHAR